MNIEFKSDAPCKTGVMGIEEQQLCRWCCEPIQMAASICPHCGMAQKRWSTPDRGPLRLLEGTTMTVPQMRDGTETKPCGWCAEPIRAQAKACPYCRRLQPKWKVRSEWFALVPLLMLLSLFLGAGAWLRQIFGPGRDFEPFRGQILVENSNVHFGQGTNGNFISAIGTLRNASPYAWKEIQLEAQYYDSNGRLVDTRSESRFGDTLLPGTTNAFRIRGPADKPESAYVSHKVFVRSAKDARKWP